MKTIIVPTDFSKNAMNAVEYAVDMALDIHASITLVHICPMPAGYSEMPVPADIYTRMLDDAEKNMKELKQKVINRTGEALRIYTEVEMGGVVSALQEYCSKLKPYAVIMSSHGAGGVERVLFGSNTLAAIKNLSWPLIIIPAEAKFHHIQRIGLACDLKKVTDTVPLEEVKALIKEFKAKLLVLHVNSDATHPYGPEVIEQSGLLNEMLDELHPSWHFLDSDEIDTGISEFAEKHKLDMLIVIPKKHSLIGQLFHKSETKKLALHTHIPIMSIHE